MNNSLIEYYNDGAIDEDWYLVTYPDVALAGASAKEHYLKYGKLEGRYPRFLLATALEEKLWTGYSKLAQDQLYDVFLGLETGLDEKLYAAWALARWHSSYGQWATAEPFANFFMAYAISSIPHYVTNQGLFVLLIEIYSQLNKRQMIDLVIAQIPPDQKSNPNLLLAKANAVAPNQSKLDSQEIDAQKLSYINEVFRNSQLNTIEKINYHQPLALDNIKGSHAVHVGAEKKISVVIPAYNAEMYIATAIRGLLDQTWKNLEIIVVDDGSTDNTLSIVERYMLSDDRVKVIQHNENRGAYAARNTALAHVSGDFLTTHDSDDWSHPQRLELQIAPLLINIGLKASIAKWVRIDSKLHFQKWRPDAHLIHTSVSTLLYRSKLIIESGGWDEVRVAADSELFERVKTVFGAGAIAEVLVDAPLVLARHVPNSLTNAAATHARSEFWGLRRTYAQLYAGWHASFKSAGSLPSVRQNGSRCFPAPVSNLGRAQANQSYTIALIGDFSKSSACSSLCRHIIQTLLDSNISFTIFHWPDFYAEYSHMIDQFFLQQAAFQNLDLLLPDQEISAHLLLFIGDNFSNPLDQLPRISFDRYKLISKWPDFDALLADARTKQSEEDYALIRASLLFDADWYLAQYPDIRAGNIDPISHYINHGFLEGRAPSPEFNATEYYKNFPFGIRTSIPALVHYLKYGKDRGYSANHPRLQGALPRRAEVKTILLCGHASDRLLFGAERSLLDILDALAHLEFNVIVVIPSTQNPEYISELRKKAHEIIIVPSPLWTQTPIPSRWSIDKFRGIFSRYAIDAVSTNTIMQREPLIAARLFNIPSLVHVHEVLQHDDETCENLQLRPEAVYSEVARLTDVAIANSKFTASHLACFKQVHIVSNTVDFENFDIQNVVDPFAINIGLISSNLPKKGIYDFLKLAKAMALTTPNARFFLVGPHNDHIVDIRSSSADVPPNLRFLEYSDSPVDAISKMNIVLNISQCQETFGRTLLEAMAARRPVVVYDRGALNEIVENNVSGFVVPFQNISILAEKVKMLCDAPKSIIQMGSIGRAKALARYNRDEILKQVRNAYHSIV